ncbi:MAG TPA: Fic family protein [Gallionella sp.]|nr:Fic family protein [Gallionella sp.]
MLDVITELEHLRRLQLKGDTPGSVFYQLKHIFHMLESLGSARIEGNHTTLADYVESSVGGTTHDTDQFREISNIEEAMSYVESAIERGTPISEQFIRELHNIAVRDLEREGDATPGAYRKGNVIIAMSAHKPPEPSYVPSYMQQLTDFINKEDNKKYDLMKVAQAHHRFGWIHPFSNGNGRVVRLLTYAMLIKYGFNMRAGGRVLNPTAVFCNDRERYYAMLSEADNGEDESLYVWCQYVLEGILSELQKVDRLTDYTYVQSHILGPALDVARERQLITIDEYNILKLVVAQKVVQSKDLKDVLPKLNDAQRTYVIKKLVERKMLEPVEPGARKYVICFTNNYLLRSVIDALRHEGFIPRALD